MWIWIGIVIGIAIGVVFLRFTIVKEGTAKAVMKLGKFDKTIFQWEGHWMDEDWSIWREGEEEAPKREEKEKKVRGRILGGLWLYGVWPIHKTHKYRLRWADLHRVEEKEGTIEKAQFHDEELDHILLKPAVYWTKVFGAETIPPERIPVDVGVLVTMRVFNPYRFLFVAPPTPIEDILARIDALMRERNAHLTVDELLLVRAEILWDGWKIEREGKEIEISALKEEKLIKETLDKWGVKVAEKGVDIKKIDPPPKYSEALARRRELELEAEAKRVSFKIAAEARAAEIMGTVIESVVTAEGRPKKEVEEEFRKDPKAFYEKHKTIVSNVMTKLSMETKSYLRIETPGAEQSPLGDFLRVIAAWLRMPMGREGEKEEKKEGREKKEEEESREKKEEKEKISPKPRILTKEDLEKIGEEISKLPKEERDKRLRELAGATLKGEIKIKK